MIDVVVVVVDRLTMMSMMTKLSRDFVAIEDEFLAVEVFEDRVMMDVGYCNVGVLFFIIFDFSIDDEVLNMKLLNLNVRFLCQDQLDLLI